MQAVACRRVKWLANSVSGRRGKWIVLAIWVVAAVILMPLGGKLADETRDDTTSFLPESAESTEVVERLDRDFPGGETTQGLIVYHREGGLTSADRGKIAEDARAIEALPEEDIDLERILAPFAPGSPSELVAPSGDLAYTVLTVPTNFEESGDWGENVRDLTGDEAGGMDIYLTGDLGFSTDAEEVFGDLDFKLLLATVLLVLVLLGAIYRAVLVALTPLFVVFLAYTLATAAVYAYAKSGATVSSNGTSILIVLMFGVGTDYCLLLVSRYREELHRIEDKHDAMARALSRTGPTILASGLTVSLAMLTLALADARLTSTLGPVAAIGVASGMLAGLTLLPALLTIFGRRGFWPRQTLVAYDPARATETRPGLWRRVGDRVLQRPGPALAITLIAFVAGAIGLVAYKVDYSTTSFFKTSVESVEGFELMEQEFPPGVLAPTTVLVQSDSGPIDEAQLAPAVRSLEQVADVARAVPTGVVSDDGTAATIDVVLDRDPFTKDALEIVPEIRDAVADLGPGLTALVGGGSAVSYDFDEAIESDLTLIAPVALLVIGIILAILLRALVAPLVLIASVIVSFLCTLGLSILFIRYVVGDAGMDASIPTFAFIFLVALGIDYTIFLMARVREEARAYGTREGMLRAISATGPVITSAGVILAGTFSVLMTLPVTFTFDLGFMVALGILLDTFIVRTIMVPAAVELIGDKVWWPSSPSGGAVLHEDTGEHPAVPGREPTPEPERP
ncbi:MAG TPA: MMPL family transporter [Solirubrobacterales bacterium]|nr:MMPL family transporter [Solirubrobacterales bacterium]